jgi:hypothetical protein
MPCDTKLKPAQTITQRKEEITKVIARLSAGLVAGSIKVKLSPAGAIAFDGLTETDRDGVTDACAYRRLMVTGGALAKAKVQAAQALLGKPILTHGAHSHDGGQSWHPSHKH